MYADPDTRAAVYALYDRVFTGLSARLRTAERLGFYWQDVTTPFLEWDGARATAHVGLLQLPVIAAGRPALFAAIHAVCTDPDYRGRGAFRRMMERALAHADRRHDTIFSTTGQPELYTRFGFRSVAEQQTVLDQPSRAPGPAARPLTDAPADLAALRRLMHDRAPVSRRLYGRDSGWCTAINHIIGRDGTSGLHFAEDLDVIIAADVDGSTLRLQDVFAADLPPLDALLGRLPLAFDRVVFEVGADRLAPDAPLQPCARDEHDVLMVRGAWPLDDAPAMMPILSRC